ITSTALVSVRIDLGRHITVARLRQLPAENLARDERAQHLRSAAADREHTHITRHALKREVARVTARTKYLQRIVDDLDRRFGREDLGLRSKCGIRKRAATWTARGRRSMEHQARCCELCLHVGEHPLQTLEFADGSTELLTRLCPFHGMLERARSDAH